MTQHERNRPMCGRHARAALGAAATFLLALGLMAPAAASAQVAPEQGHACPNTFQVLHDDRIGPLHLPAGHYTITLLQGSRVNCAQAADLFRQFLERWRGDLPGAWRVIAQRSEFRRGTSNTGFSVSRGDHRGGGGGGTHPATGRACAGFFHVLHDDVIGRLRLAAGEYRITLLSVGRLSCRRASQLFARFLRHYDGRLPGHWRLDPETATFSAGHHVGFRVKHAVGEDPRPGAASRHPAGRFEACPTFRVLHDDRIGRARFPAGRYLMTALGGYPCQRASRAFAAFLEDFDGSLPGRWQLVPRTATFRLGDSGRGFRVKLIR